jgi:hypothetical protein
VGAGGSDHEGFGTENPALSCRSKGIDNLSQAGSFALVNPSHA